MRRITWLITELFTSQETVFRISQTYTQIYGMLFSVGFSGVDVLLISLWIHGVENFELEIKPIRTQTTRTLLQRAEMLVSEKDDKTKEVEQTGPENERLQTEDNSRQHVISLPYISKLSKQLARIFKSHDIPVYHKPIKTLRSLLVHPKDKTDKAAKCGWHMTSDARTATT